MVKNLPANARDSRDEGSIPGLGRSSGEGNGNPFHYSCLENSMDRVARAGYNSQGQKESDMTEHSIEHNAAALSYSLLYQYSG